MSSFDIHADRFPSRQEPDPTTNSRAVPIYATTVRASLYYCLYRKQIIYILTSIF